MGLNILFYSPYAEPVNYIESLVVRFIHDGHKLSLFTQCEPGLLHKDLSQKGCAIITAPGYNRTFPGKVKDLVSICKSYDFDVIHSHYQQANIVAITASPFIRTPVVVTRHHSDCGFVDPNWKERFADRIINRFARYQISPSSLVTRQIREVEGGTRSQLFQINYAYDFSLIPEPDPANVERIRKLYPGRVLLVMAARFITEKRHLLLLESMNRLKDTPLKLLLLGKGPVESDIRDFVQANHLQDLVSLEGFRENIQDYYQAADLIVHFSQSEASNSAIKEAAILGKTVMVCDDVGDFQDYIDNEKSGFLMSKFNPSKDFEHYIKEILQGKYNLDDMGKRLKKTVINRFSIDKVMDHYNRLHEEILANAEG